MQMKQNSAKGKRTIDWQLPFRAGGAAFVKIRNLGKIIAFVFRGSEGQGKASLILQ